MSSGKKVGDQRASGKVPAEEPKSRPHRPGEDISTQKVADINREYVIAPAARS